MTAAFAFLAPHWEKIAVALALGFVVWFLVDYGRDMERERWQEANERAVERLEEDLRSVRAENESAALRLSQALSERDRLLEELRHGLETPDDGAVCFDPDGVQRINEAIRELRGTASTGNARPVPRPAPSF